MKASSSPGATPALPASPATLTSTRMRSPGRASSRCRSSSRSAESEATEWIRRTCGTISRTRLLWSCPMKSHSNSSPCAATLASRSWARFSPTSRTPASARTGRSSADTYLIAASSSTSRRACPGRAPEARSAAAAICSRSRLRFALTSSASRPVISSTMPRPPGAPPGLLRGGARSSARRRSCTARASRTSATPAASSRSRAIACRSIGRPLAMSMAERGVHLGPDLVAAGPRAGSDDRGTCARARPAPLSARTPSSSTPAARPRQPACSIATAPRSPSATGRQSAVSTITPTPRTRSRDRRRRSPRAVRRRRPRASTRCTVVPWTWRLAHSHCRPRSSHSSSRA